MAAKDFTFVLDPVVILIFVFYKLSFFKALVLPQAIATPIGGIVLDTFEHYGCRIGLGYIALFLITSVYFAISGYFVTRIKKAK